MIRARSTTFDNTSVQEGFGFIGIEMEAEYDEIARRRIAYWSQPEEPKKNGKPKILQVSTRVESSTTLIQATLSWTLAICRRKG